MANVISLHKRQVFFEGESVEFARLYVYESETTTQVEVYSDSALTAPRSQPIEADAAGVLPVCYVAAGAALRLLVTDQNDVPLPGFPMDDITPEPVGNSAADEITFTPIAGVAETNVQDAIESVYETASGVNDAVAARFTPFTTAGSSNAYTLTPSPAATEYVAGQSWVVRPDRVNTGAATLNVSGLGARNLMRYGPGGTLQGLAAGELQIGREFFAYDDGTQIIVMFNGESWITSNSNGTSVRWASGWQECTQDFLAASMSTINLLTTSWTFPQAFSSATDLVAHFQPTGGGTWASNLTTITIAEMGPIVPGTPSTTACAVNVYKAAATTSKSFESGDNVYLQARAAGRWF